MSGNLVAGMQRGNIFSVGGQPQFIFIVRAREPCRSKVDAVHFSPSHFIQPGPGQCRLSIAGIE